MCHFYTIYKSLVFNKLLSAYAQVITIVYRLNTVDYYA